LPAFAKVAGDPQDGTSRLKAFVAAIGLALEYTIESVRRSACLRAVESLSFPDFPLPRNSQSLRPKPLGLDPSRFGSDHVGGHNGDYIQLHSGDKDTIAESLAPVRRTVAQILKAILPDDLHANLAIR
jgi:hypothetical protein